MLHLAERKTTRDNAMSYIDGRYTGSADKVYLNEALPALEDVIFGTIPSIPTVDVTPRQPDQQALADKCSALIDATMESGLVRCYPTAVAIEWDEAGYGIGVASMGWFEEVLSRPEQTSIDPEYAAPHMAHAAEENYAPDIARVSETDDHTIHVSVHEEALAAAKAVELPGTDESRPLRDHILQHWSRIGKSRNAHPVARRVDPLRFLYDPDTTEWDDRRWEAEECDEYVASLRRIPGVRNLDPDNCPALDDTGTTDPNREIESFDFENQRVKVWKIHDRANHSYLVIPFEWKEGQKPLVEADWPFGGMELYRAIIHRPKPESIHGYATLELVEPILEELARTNAVIRRHNRRASKYKLIVANTVHKKDQEKFMSDNPVEGMDPAALATAKEFKPPALPVEISAYRQLLLDELRRLMGTDAMQQGGDTTHQITATEAGLRGGYHDTRLSRRRRHMSELLEWMARNIILMYRAFFDENIAVNVSGPLGTTVEMLDPASIPEDLMVKLDISMVTEEGQQQAALNAQTFVEILSKVAPGVYDPTEALKYLGQAMKIPNPARFFVSAGQMGGPAMPGGMTSQPNLAPGGQGPPMQAAAPQSEPMMA